MVPTLFLVIIMTKKKKKRSDKLPLIYDNEFVFNKKEQVIYRFACRGLHPAYRASERLKYINALGML